jgi:3-oxoadipate enol-lactonase
VPPHRDVAAFEQRAARYPDASRKAAPRGRVHLPRLAAYLADHPETVAEFRASPAPDLGGFRAAAAACSAHDALPRLGDLTQPALVLAGRYDILTRQELSEELAGALPDAQLHLLDAGHMTFWEAPEAWGQSVRRWLERRLLT